MANRAYFVCTYMHLRSNNVLTSSLDWHIQGDREKLVSWPRPRGGTYVTVPQLQLQSIASHIAIEVR